MLMHSSDNNVFQRIPVILLWTRYSSDADAIVFHIRDLNTSDLPLRRSPKQFYVFLLLESPHYTGKSLWEKINGTTKYKIPDDYFNLTVTYRKDGDIFAGYGSLQKVERSGGAGISFDYKKIARSIFERPKFALQLVSNCQTLSGREQYSE
ncbi:unnamed protein product, partial [Enterobius vermicularis]|uniref:Glyco_tran_10_N domain-containing protein n=1 Tax=Enterobius vermicularis TaxID=51028 RepID=A0A0N4UU00_ENTVE